MGTIIEALRQVTLPTEAEYDLPCVESLYDDTDRTTWHCSRFADHDGPHVATYDRESDADPRLSATIIGLAWTD